MHLIMSTKVSDSTKMAVPSNSALFKGRGGDFGHRVILR